MQKRYLIKGIAIVFTVVLTSCATYWKGTYSLNEKLVLRKAQVSENDEDYSSALDFYTAVYNEHKEDGFLNYKMGECYLLQGDVKKALTYLEVAEAKNSGLEPMFSFRYGQALQKSGSYKKAAEVYDRFKKAAKAGDIKYTNVDLYINQVAFASKAIESPVNAAIYNLGDSINSTYSDGLPNVTADGKTLVFTSARPEGKGGSAVTDGAYFQDIYSSTWNDKTKKWSKATMLPDSINTTGHDANTSISPDGTSIFLYRNIQEANYHTGSGDLYVSAKINNNKWGAAKQVPFMNTDYFEAGACVSADGKKVFFISERNDVLNKNYGNTDIFMMELKDSVWSKPFNIGAVVNTSEDEIGLYIHPDSKTLFFASNGHDENMGGYDIFKTVYENGVWSKPVNLGYPINTFRDERHFVMSADGSKAYYTTQQDPARKDLDIYQVNLTNYNVITGENKSVVLLKGTVMDASAGKPLASEVFIRNVDSTNVTRINTSDKGVFQYNLLAGQKYVVEAAIKGFKPYLSEIQAPVAEKEMAFVVSLESDGSQVKNTVAQVEAPANKEVFEVEHLIFTESMDSLKFGPKSRKIMEKDLNKLRKEGYLKIKITGHYFGDGNSKACMEQSKKLADYVRFYFVSHGVPFDRILVVAAGNTQALTKDVKSKKGKAENTRIDVLLEY